MALKIDSITRTSSVVPFTDPIVVDIAYSGGAGPVDLKAAGSVIASGGSSGTFSGVTIPPAGLGYPTTWGGAPGVISTAGYNGVITNIGVEDGSTTDYPQIEAWPFEVSLTPSAVSGNTYSWNSYYYDWFTLFGGVDVAAPYDHWFDLTTFTHSLTRTTSNPQAWIFGIPFTSILWNFGDGHTSTSTTPTHTFTTSGSFHVTGVANYFPVPMPVGGIWFGNFHPSEIYTLDNGYYPITVTIPGGWHIGPMGMGS